MVLTTTQHATIDRDGPEAVDPATQTRFKAHTCTQRRRVRVLACRRLAKATDASALEAQAFGVKQRGTLILPAILRHGQEGLPVPELESGERSCHVGEC